MAKKQNDAAAGPEMDWSGHRFVHRLVEVDGVQIAEPMSVETPFGPVYGAIGDWLVAGEGGQQWFCTDEYFRENYEPVADKQYVPAVDRTSRR
ncbi:MAG: hypothetical protein ACYC6G_20080 [Desulfobaccales bacterium]